MADLLSTSCTASDSNDFQKHKSYTLNDVLQAVLESDDEHALREKCPYLEIFWSECGKIRTTINPNTGTFYAVMSTQICLMGAHMPLKYLRMGLILLTPMLVETKIVESTILLEKMLCANRLWNTMYLRIFDGFKWFLRITSMPEKAFLRGNCANFYWVKFPYFFCFRISNKFPFQISIHQEYRIFQLYLKIMWKYFSQIYRLFSQKVRNSLVSMLKYFTIFIYIRITYLYIQKICTFIDLFSLVRV